MWHPVALPSEAKHRLLEINPQHGGFTRNEENSLECDLLVIDETSMVDVPLMNALLRAIPKHCGAAPRTVERVTYHNAENGFAVLKVQARGKRDLVTVVGHAASVMEGEWVTASGSWVSDRTHGVQFKGDIRRRGQSSRSPQHRSAALHSGSALSEDLPNRSRTVGRGRSTPDPACPAPCWVRPMRAKPIAAATTIIARTPAALYVGKGA